MSSRYIIFISYRIVELEEGCPLCPIISEGKDPNLYRRKAGCQIGINRLRGQGSLIGRLSKRAGKANGQAV